MHIEGKCFSCGDVMLTMMVNYMAPHEISLKCNQCLYVSCDALSVKEVISFWNKEQKIRELEAAIMHQKFCKEMNKPCDVEILAVKKNGKLVDYKVNWDIIHS